MTSRELVVKTLNHQPVARTPRDVWLTPPLEAQRPDDVAEIAARFPGDVAWVEPKPAAPRRAAAKPAREGAIVDAWGCTWLPAKPGQMDEIVAPPLSEAAKLAAFEPPAEAVEASRFAKLGKAGEAASRFLLARSDVRPFERLQGLRGTKAAVMDLARDTKEIRRLLAKVHETNCRELELWGRSDVDGVAIRDIWGVDGALHVAPAMWREIFKPLYRDYCRILHEHDKFVFFLSGGNISDVLSDLVKIEVDAVHSQWSAMHLDRLAKRFRGRITFWGGLDRPEALGRGPDEIRQSVQRVRQALDFGAGGLIAQCRWDPETPIQAVVAFCEQWLAPLPMHST